MDQITRNSIDDAAKRLHIGPYAPEPSLEQKVLARANEMHSRVADMVRQTWKDRAPTKDEFAHLVGSLYEAELRAWAKESSDALLFYMTQTLVSMSYKTLVD